MPKVLNLLIVFIMIMVMACPCAFASDPVYQPSVGLKIVDALCVRIPMIGASCISTAAFIVISPVVHCIGIGEPIFRAMVEAPWRFTEARPLGDFTGRTKDGKPIYVSTDW